VTIEHQHDGTPATSRVSTASIYRVRWATYLRSLDDELRAGQSAKPIDWFAIGEAWNHGTQRYSDQPYTG
jgi:alpha-N-acetylglucosaminidase